MSISGSAPGDVWAVMGNALFRGDGTGWSRADDEMQALLTAQHPGYAAVPYAVRVAAGTIWVMGKTFIWRRDAGGWRMFELTNSRRLRRRRSERLARFLRVHVAVGGRAR